MPQYVKILYTILIQFCRIVGFVPGFSLNSVFIMPKIVHIPVTIRSYIIFITAFSDVCKPQYFATKIHYCITLMYKYLSGSDRTRTDTTGHHPSVLDYANLNTVPPESVKKCNIILLFKLQSQRML